MSRFTQGFTLIELIVSVVIIMTITGIGVAGYTNFNTTQRVKQTALTLKNNLRLAQTRAMSSITSSSQPTICGGALGVSLSGYQVSFNDPYYAIPNYVIEARCSDGNVAGPKTIITVPQDMTLYADYNPILFKALSQGVDFSSLITVSLGSIEYQVSVDVGGTISGPSVP